MLVWDAFGTKLKEIVAIMWLQRRRWLQRIVWTAPAMILAGVVLFYLAGPEVLDWRLNRRYLPPPYQVSTRARDIHAKAFVADLHADTLLWRRDLLKRSSRGHLDVPRLIEGNVALQVFSTVTRVPVTHRRENPEDAWDAIVPLAVFQGWPASAWFSPLQRAMYQAGRLEKAARLSNGKLSLIRTREDLERYVKRRENDRPTTAALLSADGLHCLENDLENMRVLFNAGFRLTAPVYPFENAAYSRENGGLTPFVRRAIHFAEGLKIILDLAQIPPGMIDEVLDAAARPVVVSHTGLAGVCDSLGALDDVRARRIADAGGLIGIGQWEDAICGTGVESVIRTIRYAVDLMGIDHVALGSNHDAGMGAIVTVEGTVLLTEGLLDAGFSEEDAAKILGGNVFNFLRANLPSETDAATLVPRPE